MKNREVFKCLSCLIIPYFLLCTIFAVAGGSESRPLNHDLNSVQWSEVDMKLITPCRDQTVGLWILRDGELIRLNSFRFHKRSVLTACFKPQNSGSNLDL